MAAPAIGSGAVFPQESSLYFLHQLQDFFWAVPTPEIGGLGSHQVQTLPEPTSLVFASFSISRWAVCLPF
jgi:hypothetical protein